MTAGPPEVGGESTGGNEATSPQEAPKWWINRATVRGSIMVIAGLFILLWPEATARVLTLVVGFMLLALGITDLIFKARRDARADPRISWVMGGLVVISGLALVLIPEKTLVLVARAVGVLAIIAGIRMGARALRLRRDQRLHVPGTLEEVEERLSTEYFWEIAQSAVFIAAGAVLWIIPEAAISTVVLTAAVLTVAVGLVIVAYGLQPRSQQELSELDSTRIARLLRLWLTQQDVGSDRREEIAEDLYFEAPHRASKRASFAVMMLLSVVIATLAVIQDSTAVVIGAMLIAPLMTPIMGVAAGIVNGWIARAATSAFTVLLAAFGAILVALIVSLWVPGLATATSNSQIASRVNPNLLDMAIALAAGAAGAYGFADPRVSSSLPGVAIAVALVPPLAVVGVNLEAGEWSAAGGAFLLFLTNAVSIVLAGALVFVMAGLVSIKQLERHLPKARATLATVVVSALLIMVPLGLTSESIFDNASAKGKAQEVVDVWVEEADLEVISIDVEESTVTVIVAGPGRLPSLAGLQGELSTALGKPVLVTVQAVPSAIVTYSQDGQLDVETPYGIPPEQLTDPLP